MKRTIANDIADPPIKVHARCETQVDADRAQLRRDQPSRLTRKLQGGLRIAVVHAPQYPHRRYRAEAVAKTLHSAALVINRDE